ncbi:uncharacterized protein [Diadema setosum]|uniref:uncharacterized protein n=1 Tax=Diadema setosum TaxID=31175 RepID=UPI003B3A1E3D
MSCSRKNRKNWNYGDLLGVKKKRKFLKRDQHCKAGPVMLQKSATGGSPICSFSSLPAECKVHIFSFLNDTEKCRAAMVCSSWANIMRTPQLWQVADFTYGLSRGVLPKDDCKAISCIKERAKNYVYHLVSRGAFLRSLIFELDIIDGDETWLKFLIYCLKMTNSHELQRVHAKWTKSPDFMPISGEENHWKSARVKSFLSLLITLSETSPLIEELYTPCDWSEPTVGLLCKFKHLHTLELDKYWVFALFRQENLDELLGSLPRLKRFKLTVFVPLLGTLSFPEYKVSSKSLEVLDISNCTCFFLRSVDLPSLTAFTTARNKWNGPMLSRDALQVSCLHNILKVGAPNLRHYNDCVLAQEWRSTITANLEEALKSSCYCSRHKRCSLLY